jgi:radical SAM superfamily enzyme YgiQ (UPF0313 family)
LALERTTKVIIDMQDKIDILLVVPHQPQTAEILSGPSGITPPLGIGYIASYLERNNFSVSIIDNSVEKLNKTEFQDYIRKKQPLCVGFSVCTSSYNNALYLATLVKEVNDKIYVVMGGMQPSSLPREVLKNNAVDIVVRGEGEETTLELLRAIKEKQDLNKIEGLALRIGDEIIETPDRPLIGNLDSLPFPAYHLLAMDKYTLPASRRITRKRCGSLVTSRGCPYRCLFCSHNSIFKGKLRFRSPENIIAEIRQLVEIYNIGELLIWDDSFLLDKKRALEICRLMIENKFEITWSCSSRVDHISDDLAGELYRAGCRLMLFGAESGSQIILNSINKKTTIAQIENAVSVCRRNNILSFCSFILGTPDETEETAQETIRFSKRLNPDFAIFCIFAPLPGSVLFDRLIAEGKIEVNKINWDRYINLLSNAPPMISASILGTRRLVQLQKKGFRTFYFRPAYIFKRFKMIHSAEQFYQAWRGLRALIQLELNRFVFEG